MTYRRYFALCALFFAAMLLSIAAPAQDSTSQTYVMSTMIKTADWQLAQMNGKAPIGWEHAAFYAGVMAFSRLSADTKYTDAIRKLAEKNHWMLGNRPFHADDHCIGQTYLDFYDLKNDDTFIAPTKTGMDELIKQLASEDKLTWNWCDALFMAPATLAHLSVVTRNIKYLDAMDKEWWKTTKALYDIDDHLFYRDDRFLTQRTSNGKKVFWSRGNGWVLAGLARVLQYMPKDYPTRARYLEQYQEMVSKVIALQPKDGLWRPSLLDPQEIKTGETSGTGFFCYAIAWGINDGILDARTYRPAVDTAWNALVNKVGSDGRLGYVQPGGDRPAQFKTDNTAPYGVGAFLLAGSEVYKLSESAKIAQGPADTSIEQITRQYKAYYLAKSKPNLKQALAYASSMLEDGSWANVDYNSKQRADWPTGNHITRLLIMTTALSAPELRETEQNFLEASIHKALSYWMKHDFKCINWWYNEIGGPQRIGTIALLLGDKLSKEEFDYVTGTVMKRSKIGMTGQNRVWLAGNTLINGLLNRDIDRVAHAASVIFYEVDVTTREGIQPDFSFHQHGPQLQFGNYGLAFADEQLKWATILNGTKLAPSAKKLDIMRNYLLQGLQWVTWRGTMDISSCGRQICLDSPKGKGEAVSHRAITAQSIDISHLQEYTACVKRNQPGADNDLIGTRFFWRSDYMVDRRKDFCLTLKMCSKRVIGAESINSENLSGYHLADGAMYLYRTGDEYDDVLPVWDWRKIPGVTCAQKEGRMPSFRSYTLDTDFVGGADDGANACAVLDYRRDGVSAKKAWFFIGDQVICLGCGIKAAKEVTAPVTTSINQCRLRGDVRISFKNKTEIAQTGSRTDDNANFIEHDGMRYTFLQPQRVTLSNQKQTGNWSKVQKTDSTPKADVTQDVFSLYIDHGAKPDAATYAYSISPITTKEPKPEILSNTEKLQAVRAGNIVSAILYAPGSVEYASGQKLELDAPCALLLNMFGKRPSITLSDPTHALKSIIITLNGYQQTITLPTGGGVGRSVTFSPNGGF
ncbi:MAG: glycoside hydrolase family 88 protein [Armatimonadetes bacterium]|nr:glycoside hydrolase family 88 protein [Armatimonadota bacterium]